LVHTINIGVGAAGWRLRHGCSWFIATAETSGAPKGCSYSTRFGCCSSAKPTVGQSEFSSMPPFQR
jgi:hypothetical protein